MVIKNRYWIPVSILIAILIFAYLTLSYWLTRYVNRVLSEIPGYEAHIRTIDIKLWEGAYTIHDLVLNKIEDQKSVPFALIEQVELSVEWKALFDGAFVGEVYFLYPQLNFITQPDRNITQLHEDIDWTQPIKDLFPLKINRFEVENGKISFVNLSDNLPKEIYIDNLQLIAWNLKNTTDTRNPLPSYVTFRGQSIGEGRLSGDIHANFLKTIPDFDLNAQLVGINLPAINEFTRSYANFDFQSGMLDIFTEIALKDNLIQGYIKPTMTNLNILDLEEKKENIMQTIKESFLEVFTQIFRNQPEDQFATKIPIEGTIENPQTGIIPVVVNILSNAFVEAFSKRIDNEVAIPVVQ